MRCEFLLFALVIAIAAPAAAGDQESINFDKICDALPPGLTIMLGGDRFTRTEDGGCLIENMRIRRPAPAPKNEEGRS